MVLILNASREGNGHFHAFRAKKKKTFKLFFIIFGISIYYFIRVLYFVRSIFIFLNESVIFYEIKFLKLFFIK